jgi:hypothetical protein
MALLLGVDRASALTKPGLTRWIDTAEGYSIVLPNDWYVIPRNQGAIRQEVASLRAAKNTSLAAAFSSILASPASVAELSKYRFQAFLWPPLASVVPTEVSLQIVANIAYRRAELSAIAETYARSLAGPGASIEGPSMLRLPAGTCEFIRGSVSNGGGVHTGVELYIFVHDERVYTLSFGIDARFLRTGSVASALRTVAGAFSFSTRS